MNKRAVELTEALSVNIENSTVFKGILKIVKDKNILNFYKMQLVDNISARLLFSKTAKDITEKCKNHIYLIPDNNNFHKMEKELIVKEELKPFIMPGISIINQIRNIFLKINSLLIFVLLPSAYIILNLKKITLGKINKKKYNIAMPVIWGFHRGDIIINGVKRLEDDSYLYNEKIRKGQIVHIFKHWRFTDEVEKKFKKVMDNEGISYLDSLSYRINLNLLLILLKMQLKIISQILLNLFFVRDNKDYIIYSNKVIYYMIKKYLEFENVDYKVELIRHDYDPSHIVETILCNQHNKQTVGIQHGSTAGPYIFPQLCFIHLNKYCIFSRRHLDLHAPFWKSLDFKKTGNYRVDHLVSLSKNHYLKESIKKKINKLHGSKKYNVLILFPGPRDINIRKKWSEIYEALLDLVSLNIDCNVFLRFRQLDNLDCHHIKCFKNLPKMDSRFIIDLTNFTSYELMAVSDLVISNSSSSGMIDAISMNKKVFTFDFQKNAQYSFGKYGRDLILNTKNDVLNLFENLKNDFTGYDCDWNLLKKEYNYFYDGKCLERLQHVVSETVSKNK